MTIGERLQYLRTQRGWSLSDLAQRSSVSRGYLHQLEQGANSPTLDTLQAIGHAIGVSVSVLIGDCEEQVPGESGMLAAYRAGDLQAMMRLALERVQS